VHSIKPDTELLIIDDLNIEDFGNNGRWKAFFGLQSEFNISGKYVAPKTIHRSWKGFIYLTNDPLTLQPKVTNRMIEYIEGNCDTITIEAPLF
jgi:hypothetical protein